MRAGGEVAALRHTGQLFFFFSDFEKDVYIYRKPRVCGNFYHIVGWKG